MGNWGKERKKYDPIANTWEFSTLDKELHDSPVVLIYNSAITVLADGMWKLTVQDGATQWEELPKKQIKYISNVTAFVLDDYIVAVGGARSVVGLFDGEISTKDMSSCVSVFDGQKFTQLPDFPRSAKEVTSVVVPVHMMSAMLAETAEATKEEERLEALRRRPFLESNTTLLLLGGCKGFQTATQSDKILMISSDNSSWRELKLALPNESRSHGSVFLNGEIYLFGVGRGTRAPKRVYKFEKTRRRWTVLADMLFERTFISCSCVILNGCIYVIGGAEEFETFRDGVSGWRTHSSMEMYDPLKNEWVEMAPMLRQRRRAAAVVIRGKIYVTDLNEFNDTLECYDPVNNAWAHFCVLPVTKERTCSLLADREKLIVFTEYDTLWTLNVEDKELKWNILNDPLSSPKAARSSHFLSVKRGNELVVIGDLYRKPIRTVRAFNGTTWRNCIDLPDDIVEMSAITMSTDEAIDLLGQYM